MEYVRELGEIVCSVSNAILMDLKATPDVEWETLILHYAGAAVSRAEDVVYLLEAERTQSAATVARSMVEACVHCINLSMHGYVYANTIRALSLIEHKKDLDALIKCGELSDDNTKKINDVIRQIAEYVENIHPVLCYNNGKSLRKQNLELFFEKANKKTEYLAYRRLCKMTHADLINVVEFGGISDDCILLNPPGAQRDKIAIALATSEFLLSAMVSTFTYFKLQSEYLRKAIEAHNSLTDMTDTTPDDVNGHNKQ